MWWRKNKGEFLVVYSSSATWSVNGNGSPYNEYCNYDILYNSVTNEYKLVMDGYRPRDHTAFDKVNKTLIGLREGVYYARTGVIYITNSKSKKENSLDVSKMNETECKVQLDIALKEENYELAEKIRKRLEDL